MNAFKFVITKGHFTSLELFPYLKMSFGGAVKTKVRFYLLKKRVNKAPFCFCSTQLARKYCYCEIMYFRILRIRGAVRSFDMQSTSNHCYAAVYLLHCNFMILRDGKDPLLSSYFIGTSLIQ